MVEVLILRGNRRVAVEKGMKMPQPQANANFAVIRGPGHQMRSEAGQRLQAKNRPPEHLLTDHQISALTS